MFIRNRLSIILELMLECIGNKLILSIYGEVVPRLFSYPFRYHVLARAILHAQWMKRRRLLPWHDLFFPCATWSVSPREKMKFLCLDTNTMGANRSGFSALLVKFVWAWKLIAVQLYSWYCWCQIELHSHVVVAFVQKLPLCVMLFVYFCTIWKRIRIGRNIEVLCIIMLGWITS